MNQRASAFFAGEVCSKTRANTTLQSYRNKQTDRTTLRSAVRRSSEDDGIESGEQRFDEMNPFRGFFESLGKFVLNRHVVAILVIFDTSRTDIQRYVLMSSFGHLLFVTED